MTLLVPPGPWFTCTRHVHDRLRKFGKVTAYNLYGHSAQAGSKQHFGVEERKNGDTTKCLLLPACLNFVRSCLNSFHAALTLMRAPIG